MLQQQQPNSPPQLKHQQPKSPPQVQVITKPVPSPQLHPSPSSPQQPLQTMTVSVSADGKISPVPQSILKNAKFVPVGTPQTVNVVQTPSKGQQVLQGLPITSQGISSVVMTNTSDKVVKAGTDFFKTHNNLQSNVNIVKPMTSLVNPNTVTFQQPSKPGTKTRTVTLSPINGIAQNNKTVSLPSSPVDTKNMVLRTSSTPYFIPMREPPKYDEAIKNRINQGHLLGEGSKLDGKPVIKSQAMDDVLEILIRNGELPPSAAQEPPPTPKTLTQTGNIPTSATVTMATVASSSSSTPLQQFSMFTTATSMVTTATISSTSSMSDVDALLNQPVHTPVPLIKPECITPPPLSFGVSTPPSQLVLNEPASSDSADLYDIDEMLNRDLSSMDWADDPTFLELSDTTCMQTDQEIKPGLLTVPCSESSSAGNSHGSEPDLAALGINDPDNSQMDVSDWLDVIMPSTGLTPLSANAPVSFPSDPILTPKTQQEVLELFNFEDGDFGTPTEFQGGLNWEKLTETTTS
ncbi:hypothetical protein FSP39_021527 [Pinctada imbricata]|uniref:MKL/myocardin-like protein 2 n=1 Tax=Pinctada imbricata TaxID=66713 RepID=A0AA89BQI1_PINIB|nr:hypothetical protein FSP39_021527 [Pinctada imbricata]